MQIELSRKMKPVFTGIVVAFVTATLYGCGAATTMIKKRNLVVETKMSETVFMEPVKPSERVVFLSVRNTTDKELTTKQSIASKLKASGYTITDDPDVARFMVQVNVLQLGKSDLRTANSYLSAGYGGAIVAGVAVGSATNSWKGGLAAGAIAAGASFVGNLMVDDVLFLMVTDLQVRERPLKGEIINQRQKTQATIGTSTRMQQDVSGGEVKWKTYRTRIVSTANKANLKFEEARPELENGLIRSISGILVEG